MPDADYKRCRRCEETKPSDDFSKYNANCKPCTATLKREERARDPEKTRAMARRHKQAQRTGEATRRTLEARFWAKVDKTDTCWLWTGKIKVGVAGGYGMLQSGAPDSRDLRAHRVAYELLVGPIPEGLELDHLCRVRHCVNPAHLEAVTHAENMRRGVNPGPWWGRRTHCARGHEYTPENTRHYHGERVCRTCKREWFRRKAARLKAESQ